MSDLKYFQPFCLQIELLLYSPLLNYTYFKVFHCVAHVSDYFLYFLFFLRKSSLRFVWFSTYASSSLTPFPTVLDKNQYCTEKQTNAHLTLSYIYSSALLNYPPFIFLFLFSPIFLNTLIVVISSSHQRTSTRRMTWESVCSIWIFFCFCSCALATLGHFSLQARREVYQRCRHDTPSDDVLLH